MTSSQELEVDAYILASSRLKTTSRGYKALKILLEQGNLLYWCLGKDNTLELAKVLIYLNFRYEHVSGGLQLRENSKLDYYYLVMYRNKPKPKVYQQESKEHRLGKMDSEEGKLGWNERRFTQ
ncbi:hypothetical protein SAMN06265349_101744 [Flavobacterium resistens]|uniref:Uncharacterized protein n=1 Tax=Flavobacterium resistens TaxID=443612 RepID=A0A521B6X7_9FLAO|nr:hypothetical protein [Flavobacterium resistens]MRX70254.1 hypothetical protein [Flavobacterium resistens]SMO42826.1 hypothetical protein SAMN06265349_101744 [Flavobacterium resistens]